MWFFWIEAHTDGGDLSLDDLSSGSIYAHSLFVAAHSRKLAALVEDAKAAAAAERAFEVESLDMTASSVNTVSVVAPSDIDFRKFKTLIQLMYQAPNFKEVRTRTVFKNRVCW